MKNVTAFIVEVVTIADDQDAAKSSAAFFF